MTSKQVFWTVRQAGGWGVKKQGSREASSVHEQQRDAWKEARRLTGGAKEDAHYDNRFGRTNSKAPRARMATSKLRRAS